MLARDGKIRKRRGVLGHVSIVSLDGEVHIEVKGLQVISAIPTQETFFETLAGKQKCFWVSNSQMGTPDGSWRGLSRAEDDRELVGGLCSGRSKGPN